MQALEGVRRQAGRSAIIHSEQRTTTSGLIMYQRFGSSMRDSPTIIAIVAAQIAQICGFDWQPSMTFFPF